MTWIARYPSLALVLAINLAWMIMAMIAPAAWAPYLWHEEESAIERIELALIVIYGVLWSIIMTRARDRLPRMLALLMLMQLVLMLSEEMDWCDALRLPHRNLRMAARAVFLPDVMDTPFLSAYLLWFLFWPLVPLRSVRAFLERAAPVRAERADAWAVIAGTVASVLVFFAVGDQEIGELQQVVVYAVLGVVTVRVVRRTKAEA